MKNTRFSIIRFFSILSNFLIIFGVVALISLCFSYTFPLWRILLGIIPLAIGILIRSILSIILRFVGITKSVVESVKTLSNDKTDE